MCYSVLVSLMPCKVDGIGSAPFLEFQRLQLYSWSPEFISGCFPLKTEKKKHRFVQRKETSLVKGSFNTIS